MDYFKIILLFLVGVIGFASYSCKKESSLNNNCNFDEPFLIKVNENKSIRSDKNSSDSSLILSFKKVIYDSRCPKPTCYLCYGSTASIKVLMTQGNDTTSITLTILGCQDEYDCNDHLYYRIDTLGYRICFLRLDPYPEGGVPINPLTYIAKLNVSKL